jgi:hypothetical protein
MVLFIEAASQRHDHNALTPERFEKGVRRGENEEHEAYNPRMRRESTK